MGSLQLHLIILFPSFLSEYKPLAHRVFRHGFLYPHSNEIFFVDIHESNDSFVSLYIHSYYEKRVFFIGGLLKEGTRRDI